MEALFKFVLFALQNVITKLGSWYVPEIVLIGAQVAIHLMARPHTVRSKVTNCTPYQKLN